MFRIIAQLNFDLEISNCFRNSRFLSFGKMTRNRPRAFFVTTVTRALSHVYSLTKGIRLCVHFEKIGENILIKKTPRNTGETIFKRLFRIRRKKKYDLYFAKKSKINKYSWRAPVTIMAKNDFEISNGGENRRVCRIFSVITVARRFLRNNKAECRQNEARTCRYDG